jgi:hypothetical protein
MAVLKIVVDKSGIVGGTPGTDNHSCQSTADISKLF